MVNPQPGQTEKCVACGKTVKLKFVATNGYTMRVAPHEKIWQWVARKGTKPRPINCPVIASGYSAAHHKPRGYRTVYYGNDPSSPVATR